MKKIFIIAPHFPPSFSPPAQRARLLVKNIPSFEYDAYVFTVSPEKREEKTDEWMSELAGNNYKLIKIRCISQYITRKFNFGDLGLRLLPFLPFTLFKHSKVYRPDFLLYLAPPWYILIAAPLVKMITGIPYGIDFIDPWVYDSKPGDRFSIKKYLSRKVALFFERWVCVNASIIYSVSKGINENLLKRHPMLKGKPLLAIPYGAEQTDYKNAEIANARNEIKIVRYIGAIWEDCYPVLDGLMPALKNLSLSSTIHIEFIGTSYATGKYARTQLDKWVLENDLKNILNEYPERISYKSAISSTMDASLMLLIGGMQVYYAASKLMGLIVSGKIFVAFVHRDSFPAILLSEINYPYFVTYSDAKGDMPVDKIAELSAVLNKALHNEREFNNINLDHPAIKNNTAYGMTKLFLEPISKIS